MKKVLFLFFLFSITNAFAQSPRWVVKPTMEYDKILAFDNGVARVQVGRKYGLIDKKGREIVPPKYNNIGKFKFGLAKIKKGRRYGVIDKKGRELLIPKKKEVRWQKKGPIEVKTRGRFGYYTRKGKEIIKPQYKGARMINSKIITTKVDDLWGLISSKGKQLTKNKYELIGWKFKDGLIDVRLEGKTGFLNKRGKEVIPLKYDDADAFQEGLAPVLLNGLWGFINKKNKMVIPCQFLSVRPFHEGLAAAKNKDKKWGFINKKGAWMIPPKYEQSTAMFFHNGLTIVQLNKKKGLIDRQDKVITPLNYDDIIRRKKTDYLITLANGATKKERIKEGFLMTNGQEILSPKYHEIGQFEEDIVWFKQDDKWGAMTTSGQLIIPFSLSQKGEQFGGLISVRTGEKIGFINFKGKEVISSKYDVVRIDNTKKLALVSIEGKYGFIDKNGREVIELQYENGSLFSEGIAPVKMNGKWGIIKF